MDTSNRSHPYANLAILLMKGWFERFYFELYFAGKAVSLAVMVCIRLGGSPFF
jgi:hypothetical protein